MQRLKNIFLPNKDNQYHPHAIRHVGILVFISIFLSFQTIYNYQAADKFQVLGYATNVSTGDLLSYTNQNRAASGLASFSLNGSLSQAAQAKANHMIANNYWAHVAPDGTTPWYFIDASGYSYSRAGENLAYGYSTSSGVVTGWMNSPSHAANILDSGFSEIGFGIANGSNFQGGENTVVVAMYGQPTQVASTPQVAPQTIEATPAPVEQTPEPVSQAPAENQKKDEESKPKEDTKKDQQAEDENVNNEEVNGQRYLARLAEDGTVIITGNPNLNNSDNPTTYFGALLTGQAHWALYLSLGAVFAMAAIYMMRHAHAMYQLALHGEHYVRGHPFLEATIVYAVVWLILFATYGAVL